MLSSLDADFGLLPSYHGIVSLLHCVIYVPSIRAMAAYELPATYLNDYNQEGCGRLLRLLHPAP